MHRSGDVGSGVVVTFRSGMKEASGSSAQALGWLLGRAWLSRKLALRVCCLLVLRLTLGGLVRGNFSSDIPHRVLGRQPTFHPLSPWSRLGLSPPPPPSPHSWAGRSEHHSLRSLQPPRARPRHLGWSELTPSKSRDSGGVGDKRATACPPAFCQHTDSVPSPSTAEGPVNAVP